MSADQSHLSASISSAADWLKRSIGAMRPQQGDAFTRAYVGHLTNRVPLLYAVLLTNNLILAVRFHGSAPDFLTLWVPLASTIPIVRRAAYWLPSRVAGRSIEQLRRDLDALSVVGPFVAFACTAWALSLYPFGDAPQQSLVHYIVACTCFASILGLGQSPLTALRMAIVSLGPACVWFLIHDHPNALAVCAVQLFVGLLLLFLTFGYHRDFVALERARQAIAGREQDTAELAELMRDRAIHDPLTGAANRRAILEHLEHALADRTQLSPWLALVDLDGFKNVNDTYGHAAGDAVLKAVCQRIEQLPDVLSFGRLGGDEFAILLPGGVSALAAKDRMTDLIERISRPVPFDNYQLAVSASIGLRRTQRRSVNECLERADTALYKAKQTPGVVIEFSESDERALEGHQAIVRAFCSANLEEQISLLYQPVVDIDTRRVESFEAFARWSPDRDTTLAPHQFISLAESTRRLRELSEIVLRRVLAECPVWERGIGLSINLSAHDLADDSTASRFEAIVQAAGAPAPALILDVTEAALGIDAKRAAETLFALRRAGFRLALDDFGTGQSSLARVHQLPLDHLKIDRSFAQNLEADPARQAVASSVLSLARQLGLGCSFEGIETGEQAKAARAIGIRSMQGYYFGKPAPYQQALASVQAA